MYGKMFDDIINKWKEHNESIKHSKEMIEKLGLSITAGIVDNLTDAITGAQNFGDAMLNILNDITRSLARIALKMMILKALGLSPGGGFTGKGLAGLFGATATEKASGGSVSGGSPYIVGERGPELFVPNSGGNIVPNNKLQSGYNSNININVTAQPGVSEQDARRQGRMIADSVKIEVDKSLQKAVRPGGMLYAYGGR